MDDVTIRPARPEDLGPVGELRWRWEQERHGTPTVPRDEFVPRFTAWARESGSSHRGMVVVRDRVVIGMAWLAIVARAPFPRAPERRSGDLQCVYVVPAERDSGVGGRLIDAVLALAGDLGVERVTVHSSERAIPAYIRRGFATSPRLLQVYLATPR
jgi:GNAT superfamily N-acetyltransferase